MTDTPKDPLRSPKDSIRLPKDSIRSPKDRILVKIERKFNDEIKLSNGQSLLLATDYSPEQHVTVEGIVIAIPDKISATDDFKKDIVPEVTVGDTLFFSYLVVFDRTNLDNPQALYQTSEGMWQNQDGDTLEIGMAPKGLTDLMGQGSKWIGVYKDKRGDMVDMMFGKKIEVEDWAAQFKYTLNDEMVYTNCLVDDIWMVDYMYAILVKREGKYIPIGGYVMIEPITEDITIKVNGTPLIVPEYLKKATKKGEGKVLAIGTPRKDAPKISVKEGDNVFFDPRYAEKYLIDGKERLLIKQHRIFGKRR